MAVDKALVVVAGRAPQCLRCNTKGNVRHECTVPRCSSCRRFGHETSTCVKSYASVTGTSKEDDLRELLMDEADAEETAAGATGEAANERTPAGRVEVEAGQPVPEKEHPAQPKTPPPPDSPYEVSVVGTESQGPTSPAPEAGVTDMELGGDGVSGAVAKRKRESSVDGEGAEGTGNDEPPAKATVGRRPGFKPKPSAPPGRIKPPDTLSRLCFESVYPGVSMEANEPHEPVSAPASGGPFLITFVFETSC
ncbi:uncharacterized protein LOC144167551 isoform X2 [Haemaphysalis longicornis]